MRPGGPDSGAPERTNLAIFRRPRARPQRFVTAVREHGVLAFAAAASIAPLLLAGLASLQAPQFFRSDSLFPARQFTLANFELIWTQLGFATRFVNSAILSVSAAALCASIGSAAAFALTRFAFPGRTAFLMGLISVMAIPPIVIIVPLFVLFSDAGLINTYAGGILAETGLLLPFATFLLFTYMKDLPAELFEAADVDGASKLRQYLTIALPLSRPSVATTAVVTFVFAWNDLLIPLIVWPSERLSTLMTGLAALGPGRTGLDDIPVLMAAVVISVIPLFLLFIVGKKALVRGLTEGADR